MCCYACLNNFKSLFLQIKGTGLKLESLKNISVQQIYLEHVQPTCFVYNTEKLQNPSAKEEEMETSASNSLEETVHC